MTAISRSAIVPFTADAMYRLVADIESYPQFLPWCGGAKILSEQEGEVRASVMIDYKGVNKSFTTVNRQTPGQRIEMSLVEGPFSKLHGTWDFIALDDEASKVQLHLEFEFDSRLLDLMIGAYFEEICNRLVDAFTKRAVEIYGS